MKTKTPAVLWYPSDFIASTIFWTNEQCGAYIRLLNYQFTTGHLTKEQLESVTNDELVLSKFKKDRKGHFFNKRMEEEIQKRSKYSESRANNRRKKDTETPEKKEKNDDFLKEDKKNICNSYVPHMENGNENENRNEYINNNDINYEYIINYYENNINPTMSYIEREKLDYYIKLFNDDLRIIIYAVEYCKMYQACNINYLCKILYNWEKSKFKTLEEIKLKEQQSKNTKSKIIGEEEKEYTPLFEYDWLNENE